MAVVSLVAEDRWISRINAMANPNGALEGTEKSRQPVNGVMGIHFIFPAMTRVHEGGGLAARTPGVLTMHPTSRTTGRWRDRQ
jgi:hypothetical protein